MADDPVVSPGAPLDQEAPEEAEDGYVRPKSASKRPIHTPESLRLDIAAAEAGKTWMFLPQDIRDTDRGWSEYPLPTNISDLRRVAEIHLGTYASNTGARYIRRCRRALKERTMGISIQDLDDKIAKAEERAKSLASVATHAKEDIREIRTEVRQAAREALVTMQELNAEFKTGMLAIARGFMEGKLVNGFTVTIPNFTDAAGKVFTHTARLANGALDPEGKTEAEADVLSEFAKATRERLKKQREVSGAKVAEPEGTH